MNKIMQTDEKNLVLRSEANGCLNTNNLRPNMVSISSQFALAAGATICLGANPLIIECKHYCFFIAKKPSKLTVRALGEVSIPSLLSITVRPCHETTSSLCARARQLHELMARREACSRPRLCVPASIHQNRERR